jgi:hypothetical protein
MHVSSANQRVIQAPSIFHMAILFGFGSGSICRPLFVALICPHHLPISTNYGTMVMSAVIQLASPALA